MALTDLAETATAELQAPVQGSIFDVAPTECGPITEREHKLDPHSAVLFQPGWLRGSDHVFELLRSEMPWRATERAMYDRVVAVPRLICNIDPSTLTTDHPLRMISDSLGSIAGHRFTSVGLNYYRTGADSVAWHRDSIGRGGIPSLVALVSLGSPRTLAMRPFRGGSTTSDSTPPTPATDLRWRLGHGDLFVMTGACQRAWEHAVPKERGVGARISLAFRCERRLGGSPFAMQGGATIKG